MKRDLCAGDFFYEKDFLPESMFTGGKRKRTGVVIDVKRDSDGDGVVRILLSDCCTEGWGYRTFLEFHEVCG